jgi:hypothetical protein
VKYQLRTAGVVLCVPLCAALLFMWGRSTDVLDCLFYSTYRYDTPNLEDQTLTGVFSKLGSVGLWHYRQREPTPTWRPKLYDDRSRQAGSASNTSWPTPNRLGFRFGRLDDVSVAGRPGLTHSAYGVMAPYWLVIVLAAFPPGRAVLRLRRELARARRGELPGLRARRHPVHGRLVAPNPRRAQARRDAAHAGG